MTDVEQHKNREFFISVAHEYIKRPGVSELLAYLNQKTDFFWAPASLNAHLSEPGGFVPTLHQCFRNRFAHLQIGVTALCVLGSKSGNEGLTEESIAVVALFHDVCKCNTFRQTEKRRKNEKGQWESYQGYELVDRFPFGQGEKSCIIVSHLLHLTRDEMLAIRWNKGMFDVGENGSASRRAFYDAARMTPLVSLLQAANLLCAQCIE